ncbi:MAG: 30S ribosomal protein S7 [Patescibacteria group bacterium]
MRGRKKPKKVKINSDPKYNRQDFAKFINYIMKEGKKTKAQKIFYSAFEIIEEKIKEDPVKVFEKAMSNGSPLVELRARRIGGANYQVPTPISENRRFTLISRWILEASRKRKGKPMAEKLANVILETYQNQGEVIKRKEDTHRMAEANRAFAHFAR